MLRTPACPATLPEVIRLVEADNGICFGDVVIAVCADPTTAERAPAALLASAAAQP